MLRSYQWCEVIGILLVFMSTAAQIFYLEPLKREIEWRLVTFYQQQNSQVLAREVFDNRLSILQTLNAPAEEIQKAEDAKGELLERYSTSDASVANVVLSKQDAEGYLQALIAGLFGLGTLLTTVGRITEMRVRNRQTTG